MDITITGRGLNIPERFEDYVTEKADKVDKLAEKALVLEVKVLRHADKNGVAQDDRVELTLVGPGPIVRAEASAGDKYAAFDIAIGKLIERLRQAKDRRKVHKGQRGLTSLHEASAEGFRHAGLQAASVDLLERVATGEVPIAEEATEEQPWSPVVIRDKVFPSTRMTKEDAVDHMELVGHDFFLFIDATTDRPSVVYRRRGWDYGVISLEDQPA